eukprot:scaffold57279_cov18-Tisochrysis_lutea.AAC.3
MTPACKLSEWLTAAGATWGGLQEFSDKRPLVRSPDCWPPEWPTNARGCLDEAVKALNRNCTFIPLGIEGKQHRTTNTQRDGACGAEWHVHEWYEFKPAALFCMRGKEGARVQVPKSFPGMHNNAGCIV